MKKSQREKVKNYYTDLNSTLKSRSMPHGPPSCLGIYVLIRVLCGHATALTPAVGNLGRYRSGRDRVILGPPVASFVIFNFDVIWETMSTTML